VADLSVFNAVVVNVHQFFHAGWCISGGDGLEANPRATVWIFFDDVAVLLFVFAGIPDLPAGQEVQLQDGFF